MSQRIESSRAMTFQQDGAKFHNALTVRRWLDSQQFSVLKWPTQSLNLNLIEREIMCRYPGNHSRQHLKEILLELRNNIDDDDVVRPYFYSMPDRLQAVIEVKGGPTRF